jgi:hypothetical protein
MAHDYSRILSQDPAVQLTKLDDAKEKVSIETQTSFVTSPKEKHKVDFSNVSSKFKRQLFLI